MGIAHSQELDDQRLAAFDLDADLLACFHAVKEHRRGQGAGVGILLLVLGEFRIDARIQGESQKLAVVDASLDLVFKLLAGRGEIGWRQCGAGPAPERLAASYDALLQRLGKPARWLSQPAFKKLHDRLRKSQLTWALQDIGRRQV